MTEVKQVSVMKRHPDLTMDQFIELYEARHAKFGEILFKDANRYVRRYVQPMANPLTGKVEDLAFDVIMEIWWDSPEALVEGLKGIAASGLIDQIRASGETLFASQNNPGFTVVEYETPRS
jgi:hypothetical protein